MKVWFALMGILYALSPLNMAAMVVDDDEPVSEPATAAFAPFVLFRNRVLVEVSVNGNTPQRCLVDNCWSHTAFDPRTLNPPGEKNDAISYRALSNKHGRGLFSQQETMSIGGIDIDKPRVLGTDATRLLSRNLQLEIHGIIGYSTLKDYIATFDFKSERLCFSPYSDYLIHCLREHEEIFAFPFGLSPMPSHNTHIFTVPIAINGETVAAILDLGFPGGILTSIPPGDLHLTVNFSSKKIDVSLLGFRGRAYKTKARKVRLGSTILKNVDTLCCKPGSNRRLTIIGVDLLKDFNITFDNRNKCVYLIPASSACASTYYLPGVITSR